ncbi:MAG: hypothetical protein HN667_08805 [Chloroflexi bacterium]|nr:hypothetical protein [Chloroflexota bacterium]
MFKRTYLNRLGLLAVMSLAVTPVFVAGCGDDGLGAAPKPTLAPTTAPPSFVRITVTPLPMNTATPTPEVFEPEVGPPVFPLELDPELVE